MLKDERHEGESISDALKRLDIIDFYLTKDNQFQFWDGCYGYYPIILTPLELIEFAEELQEQAYAVIASTSRRNI